MGNDAPIVIRRASSRDGSASDDKLWVRIAAFLGSRARGTQITYRSVLNEWCRFLGAEAGTEKAAHLVGSATDLHALAYRRWLESRPGEKPRVKSAASQAAALATGERALARVLKRPAERRDGYQSTLSNATIHKKFAALRRIYRMLAASNLANQNPFDIDRVSTPSARSGQKRPTEMVDFSLVKEIIARAVDTTPKGLRDKAVLAVLFGGGLRRSELTRLRLNDVCESSQGTVFLRLRETKGKRDADQALPPWAAKIVRQLLESRVDQGAERSDYLFVSYRGRAGQTPSSLPISDTGVYILFKHYCQLAGAGPHVTPHSARATAITKLLADGIPHRQVQEFSRHSSIQMVELYDKRRLSVEENPAKGLTFE